MIRKKDKISYAEWSEYEKLKAENATLKADLQALENEMEEMTKQQNFFSRKGDFLLIPVAIMVIAAISATLLNYLG